ncbi:MAG: tRNA 2-thiouridine(34) synthase MnmA [Gammaproteobacteria bacterium]|jgi:tRNA-specific 2-thiouridylase|nr:tRNA 2-thiouridine(34) synthase MnmA [Gammaproteobacteria bacterium]HJP05498.1 tRNA 2-thiouridine(34) synthase MnmA [Gammaproteobacteria bacterium]
MASPPDTTVIVGISGGVDSAVAALLLQQQGYRVQGLHMTNWDEDDDYCSAAKDYQDARRVCADIGIPLHHVNFAHEYRDKVFADFLEEYRRGRTPNPDVACNRYIKFGDFLEYADRLGADCIATGHYARVDNSGDKPRLLKGTDSNKDQTYFLHAIRPEVLPRVLFPLGELSKPEVRKLANDYGLANYAKRDSTGICFIGERPFREFLQSYLPAQPGSMETPGGQVIGEHVGLMHYTLGQREGLGIGGVKDYPDAPWYVAGKDLDRNVLIVVQGQEHPLLWSSGMTVTDLNWLAAEPPAGSFDCSVRTRYRQTEIGCRVEVKNPRELEARFADPVWAVTPGQYAVFYSDDVCLGGGTIESSTGIVDPGVVLASVAGR